MDVAQKLDSNDKKENAAQKPDSKDKTEEVAQSKVERAESSKRTYDDCTYQECPSLNNSQASQMENAKKPKGDDIEEKPRVTINPILPEIQEAEKVASKPHSKDEIEEVAKSEVENLESEVSWVCPWARHCHNVDMSTYVEWPDYYCFDSPDDNDCLDDLSDNDEKDAEYKERWEKCFHVGKLPGEK